MKTLILYYSYEGHTEDFAAALGNKLDADIERIRLREPYRKMGFIKFLVLGYKTVRGILPKFENLESDLSQYDEIVVAGPVWAGRVSPPITGLFTSGVIAGKRVRYYYTHQGGDSVVCDIASKLIGEGNTLIECTGYRNGDNL